MLQRIQSLYLFIVSILYIVIIFLPLCKYPEYVLTIRGLFAISEQQQTIIINTYSLLILVIFLSLISFVTIFLYKKRLFQIKLCNLSILFQVVLIAVIIYFAIFSKSLSHSDLSPQFAMFIPVINIILTILARRRIRKDEELVRTADRIR